MINTQEFYFYKYSIISFMGTTIPQGLDYLDGIEQLFVYMQNIFVAFYIFKYRLQTISERFCIL